MKVSFIKFIDSSSTQKEKVFKTTKANQVTEPVKLIASNSTTALKEVD